jgi:hypothetical protein
MVAHILDDAYHVRLKEAEFTSYTACIHSTNETRPTDAMIRGKGEGRRCRVIAVFFPVQKRKRIFELESGTHTESKRSQGQNTLSK